MPPALVRPLDPEPPSHPERPHLPSAGGDELGGILGVDNLGKKKNKKKKKKKMRVLV